MSEIIIRPVIKEDAGAFFNLRLEALKMNPEAFGANYEDSIQKWTAESYAASRIPDKDSDNLIVCAEREGELVGMMGFIRESYPKESHIGIIWGVYTKPSARGQGIGRKILHTIINHAQKCEGLAQITLSVVTENEAAIALYQKIGFTIWGTLPDGLRGDNKSYDVHYMRYKIE